MAEPKFADLSAEAILGVLRHDLKSIRQLPIPKKCGFAISILHTSAQPNNLFVIQPKILIGDRSPDNQYTSLECISTEAGKLRLTERFCSSGGWWHWGSCDLNPHSPPDVDVSVGRKLGPPIGITHVPLSTHWAIEATTFEI